MSALPVEALNEFDQDMDAIATVYTLSVGMVLTDVQYKAIQHWAGIEDRDSERATDAFHRGFQLGLDRAGGADVAALTNALDEAKSRLRLEKVLRAFDAGLSRSAFRNMLCVLHSLDGHELSGLSSDALRTFLRETRAVLPQGRRSGCRYDLAGRAGTHQDEAGGGMSDVLEPGALAILPASAVSTIVRADQSDILGRLRDELDGYIPNATSEAGRREIGTKARKIGAAKQDLIRIAATLKEGAQKTIKAVNAEVNIIEQRMDQMRDDVLAPRLEYERQQAERVRQHQDALDHLKEAPGFYTASNPSADLRVRLDWLEAQPVRDWQEFAHIAADTLANEIATTKVALADAERREAAEAERIRLEAETAERERQEVERARRERELHIAAQAAEAARVEAEQRMARAAAEERARVEREAAEAARQADAERRRIEQEKTDAEERAAKAERDRIAAEARARADAEAAERRAEEARIAAEQRAHREREEAVAAERRRAEREAEVERERIAVADEEVRRQVAAQKADDERRAANQTHRAKINREALADLMAAGLSEEMGKVVVAAIAKGTVRHLSVRY